MKIDLVTRIILGCIFFVCLVGVLQAQETNVNFDKLDSNKGIASNTIYDIVEDDLGFIWVGTKGGLSRYDGYKFTKIVLSNSADAQFSNKTVLSLFLDSENIMWIGLKDGGLVAYSRSESRFRTYPFDDNATVDWATISIKTIYEDSHGLLWIGTFGGGVIVLDKERKVQAHLCTYCDEQRGEKLSNDFVFDFGEDDQSNIYIATAGTGINVYGRQDKRVFKIDSDDQANLNSFSKTLCFDKNNTLWIGTGGSGLHSYHVSTKAWKGYPTGKNQGGVSSEIITDLKLDEKGDLWIATDGGGLNVMKAEGGEIDYFQYDPSKLSSLSTDAIYDVHFDKSGNLWVGTYNGGVNVLKAIQAPFWTNRNYNGEKNLGLRSVLAVQEDQNNRVWIGTDGGGMFFFDAQGEKLELRNASLLLSEGDFNDVITCIQPDYENGLWFGSFANGLNYFDYSKGTIRRFMNNSTDRSSLVHNNVWDIELDKNGGLWIGTLGGGVDYLDKGTTDFIHLKDKVPNFSSVQVIDILLDRDERYLWIATENAGLERLDIQKQILTNYQEGTKNSGGLSSNNLESLYEDSAGKIWVVTDAGIDIVNPEQDEISGISIKYNFSIGNISSIEADDYGFIWIASSTGIHRLNTEDYSLLEFGFEKFLENNVYNPKAAMKLKDGRVVFGGVDGFSMINPANVEINTNDAIPVITNLSISNQPVELGQYQGRQIFKKVLNEEDAEITLSYEDRGIAFELSTTEYTDPKLNTYAYMLEGFDKEWNYVDADNRTIYYSSLKGGNYKLLLKAANSSGIWSTTQRTVKIKVLPPFWQTRWFIALISLLTLLIVFLLYRFLLNRQREVYQRQALEQEQEILKKEQQILQLTNKTLEEEVTTQKAELNASILQVAHKNEFLTVLKNRIKKIKSDADETAAKPLRSVVNIINTELKQEDYWEKFQLIFNQTFQDFIDLISNKYPTLTPNDHRLCCFIKMGLNNREIAAILNITLSAVEQAKYRLKKKIGLGKGEQLSEYIRQLGKS